MTVDSPTNGCDGRKKEPGMDQMDCVEDEDVIMSSGEETLENSQEEEDSDTYEQDDMEEDEEEKVIEKVYLPGQPLEEDEQLEVDLSAYDMLHHLNMKWPCLSFDVVRDGLGSERRTFPMSMSLVAGTQADAANNNTVVLMNISNLTKISDDNESEGEEDDEENDVNNPVFKSTEISHIGGINRIRMLPATEKQICCSLSDTGHINIFDLTVEYADITSPAFRKKKAPSKLEPLACISTNGVEGYSVDWSNLQKGDLAVGTCDGNLRLITLKANGASVVNSHVAHEQSIEDIQFSPVEQHILATCSVDQTIKIWDTRQSAPAVVVKAHESDVNVIAWNRVCSYLLASGDDNGEFKTWDLRSIKRGVPAALFKWHKKPITSLQWHVEDPSVLAVAASDDQITLWDFACEQDEEVQDNLEVPPQLLFIHQGQTDIKELHWHPQCPGVVLSTALDGMNIFKTINS